LTSGLDLKISLITSKQAQVKLASFVKVIWSRRLTKAMTLSTL